MTLLIRRAAYLLRDADRIECNVDLLTEGNRIAAIGRDLPQPAQATLIDAQGCAVVPGLRDPIPAYPFRDELSDSSDGLDIARQTRRAVALGRQSDSH